jgi:Tfp pilus assembly protein PilV
MKRTPTRRFARADDGLTMMEMVVAVGVLMVVMLSTLGVFLTVQHAQQHAEGTDRATQLATSRIERIRQLAWRDIGFYQNTYNTTTSSTDYSTRIPSGEATVILGTTDPNTVANRINPYEVTTEHRNRFTVYTTITYGVDSALGLPRTSATSGTNQYSFKRVRVTVEWQASGTGQVHTVVNESWFSPQSFEQAPPAISVTMETT